MPPATGPFETLVSSKAAEFFEKRSFRVTDVFARILGTGHPSLEVLIAYRYLGRSIANRVVIDTRATDTSKVGWELGLIDVICLKAMSQHYDLISEKCDEELEATVELLNAREDEYERAGGDVFFGMEESREEEVVREARANLRAERFLRERGLLRDDSELPDISMRDDVREVVAAERARKLMQEEIERRVQVERELRELKEAGAEKQSMLEEARMELASVSEETALLRLRASARRASIMARRRRRRMWNKVKSWFLGEIVFGGPPPKMLMPPKKWWQIWRK